MKLMQKGFTLVELLIVIAIMAILGTIGYVNYRIFNATQILNDAVSQVQSKLRVAQSYATTSVIYNNSACLSWMVKFNTDKTTISLICQTPTGDSEKLPVLTLPANVTIDSIPGGTCGGFPANTATVIYTVLLGRVSFVMARGVAGSECNVSGNIIITLKYLKGDISLTKTLTLTKGGAIDAQN